MKKILIILFPLLLFSFSACKETKVPSESNPKTSVQNWNGKNAEPILDTDTKKNYKTIITEASRMEPDFNGKYKVAKFGAGTMANGFFIINLETGIVTEGFTFELALDYSLDSNIIIRNPEKEVLDFWKDTEELPDWCVTEQYVFEDEKLRMLESISYEALYNNAQNY